MRKFLALLTAGFVWLCSAALAFDLNIARASSQVEMRCSKESFTRDDDALRSSIFRLIPNRAWFIVPATLMFVGGLVLGRSM
jgi:hypothetical protein